MLKVHFHRLRAETVSEDPIEIHTVIIQFFLGCCDNKSGQKLRCNRKRNINNRISDVLLHAGTVYYGNDLVNQQFGKKKHLNFRKSLTDESQKVIEVDDSFFFPRKL